MTTEEKLQHFYDFSMKSADTEAKQILSEYQSTLDAQFRAHKEEKNLEAERQLKDEANKARREINKALSAEQLNIKRLISNKEREIKEQLFAEVKDKLIAYKSASPAEYLDFICTKIKEAWAFAAGDEMTIYIDPSDEALQKDIEDKTGVKTTISKEIFFGGMRAVISSKNILIDESFVTLMNEAKDNFTFDGGIGR